MGVGEEQPQGIFYPIPIFLRFEGREKRLRKSVTVLALIKLGCFYTGGFFQMISLG